MTATFIGVRHHSPACARLVAATVERLRPAYVLIEGPADINDRLDELLLGHDLPIAIFSSFRDGELAQASWAPFCEYSPEWVALTTGRRCGALVRFIDLPAWHPAQGGRRNRYADAELRYTEVIERLCRTFAVDNVDVLWDHLFESAEGEPDDDLTRRLAAYFDLVRGWCDAGADDTARESYMASWVIAATAAAGERPVVVVTGGFHRQAIMGMVARAVGPARAAGSRGGARWPDVPSLPASAIGGSFVVPYAFKRLDAFDGYQAGMPSPGYYQRLWDGGLASAADGIMEVVVSRLRSRKQVVSTADLIAARAMAAGLARLRGHRFPARVDVLDGLVSALVSESLEVRLPWSAGGQLAEGTHPAVVEMVAALSGDRVGRLHERTPAPPLVADVARQLARYGLDGGRGHGDRAVLRLDLTVDGDSDRSRVLHRLRVLGIPGYDRHGGPAIGADPVLTEQWTLRRTDAEPACLIEAGSYGATLVDAAAAILEERIGQSAGDIDRLTAGLFDAALCRLGQLSDQVLSSIDRSIATVTDLASLGQVIAVTLGMFRHDRLLGTAGSAQLGAVIVASVRRALWLAGGVRGGEAPADQRRLAAMVATRDAVAHVGVALGLDRDAAIAVMARLSHDPEVPPDLRGAALGFRWSLGALGEAGDVARAVRGSGSPSALGDWLAGLFALARQEVLSGCASAGNGGDRVGNGCSSAGNGGDLGDADVLGVLDEIIALMGEHGFLAGLPALRQAFEFFPPRERETIARKLLDRRGLRATTRVLPHTSVENVVLVRARVLECQVCVVLEREGLLA